MSKTKSQKMRKNQKKQKNGRSQNPFSEAPKSVVRVPKVFGFPDRYECSLKYVEEFTFTGTGTTTNQVMRLNSLFDPNLTGTGHQPKYFDQLAAVYGTYIVLSTDFKVKLSNANANTVRYAIAVSDSAQSSTGVQDLSESKRSVSGFLGLNSGYRSVAEHTGSINMATLHGDKYVDAQDNLQATVATSPQDPAYLTVAVADANLSNAVSVFVEITLDFHCAFKDFTEVGASLIRMREAFSKACSEKDPFLNKPPWALQKVVENRAPETLTGTTCSPPQAQSASQPDLRRRLIEQYMKLT